MAEDRVGSTELKCLAVAFKQTLFSILWEHKVEKTESILTYLTLPALLRCDLMISIYSPIK